jgi:twitching motility protein PilU
MIGYRNQNSTGHIITIEDPIEFVHKHEGCIITQREVGIDTDSWDAALKNTLRQAPDVIMIGEVRTREGMDHAIAFAETGHLVLCTLHANNANQAMDRIINFFPEDRRGQLLMDLSLNLKGVVAQQLIPTPDGKAVASRWKSCSARRWCRTTSATAKSTSSRSDEGVLQPRHEDLRPGLFELYQAGEIRYEDALRYADSPNEVRLRIKLAQGGDATHPVAGTGWRRGGRSPVGRFRGPPEEPRIAGFFLLAPVDGRRGVRPLPHAALVQGRRLESLTRQVRM